MKTKKSNIAIQRETYANNGSLILKKAEISEYEYNSEMFKTGCFFLEEMYADFSEEYYQTFAYSKSFWKWWYTEWKKFETEYIGYLYENKIIPSKFDWRSYMWQIVFDNEVEASYHNQYLKLIFNGKL